MYYIFSAPLSLSPPVIFPTQPVSSHRTGEYPGNHTQFFILPTETPINCVWKPNRTPGRQEAERHQAAREADRQRDSSTTSYYISRPLVSLTSCEQSRNAAARHNYRRDRLVNFRSGRVLDSPEIDGDKKLVHRLPK